MSRHGFVPRLNYGVYEMIADPIVDEVHEIRKQMAAEHGNDLRQLGAYFMERQKLRSEKLVSFPVKKAVVSGIPQKRP